MKNERAQPSAEAPPPTFEQDWQDITAEFRKTGRHSPNYSEHLARKAWNAAHRADKAELAKLREALPLLRRYYESAVEHGGIYSDLSHRTRALLAQQPEAGSEEGKHICDPLCYQCRNPEGPAVTPPGRETEAQP